MALREVLEVYQISQNQLAKTMAIARSNIYRWVNQKVDMRSTSILEVRDALEKIKPEAAVEFVRLYCGRSPEA